MIMQRTTGSKASNHVHHASCTNGMGCKFNVLSASNQAVHNKAVKCSVRQCSDPWQRHLNMNHHLELDGVHKIFCAPERCGCLDPDGQ